MSAATEARDEAIQRVAFNAPRDWMEAAEKCVFEVALTADTFTTDDVMQMMTLQEYDFPHEPRALGAVMRRARRESWIEPTPEFRQSERVSRHAAPLRVWQSLISKSERW